MQILQRGAAAIVISFAFLTGALAQEAQMHAALADDVPVRYDTDLLSPEFHQGRRAAVLSELPENGVAVVFSSPVQNRDNDVDFEYRQSSDLYYLTGMTEPATALLLAPGGIEIDGARVRELLFVPSRDPNMEAWEGRRLGPDRAQRILGVERVVSIERFGEAMTHLAGLDDVRFFHQPLPSAVAPTSELGQQVAAFAEVAHPLPVKTRGRMAGAAARFLMAVDDDDLFARMKGFMGRIPVEDFETDVLQAAYSAFMAAESVDAWLAWRAEHIDARYADGGLLTKILNDLRSIKTDEEMVLMQRAIDITVEAQKEAMRSIEPGMHEYEVEALIEFVFRRNGAQYPGFPSIVASGENATILHYTSNRRKMEAADMVVMDIGAEYHAYSADVTRTVPVDGKFSPEQKAIYELVLAAQDAGIAATRAGSPFAAPHEAATRVIADGLIELGLISEREQVRRFFMHGTSHYLGLSVHDAGARGPLAAGMVITVEPGIYISPAPDIEKKWWNIGVRIEDDIAVTSGDPINMSSSAPRTVEAIERLMRETGLGNSTDGVLTTTLQSSM